MKKRVLRALIFLLCSLIVCFFFSGTIKTLTTPKVMIAYPTHGKLAETIVLDGKLLFSDVEEVIIPSAGITSGYRIMSVNIAPGMYVEPGQLLFEMEAMELDSLIEIEHKNYLDALTDLLELEKRNATIRLSYSDQAWLDAYDTLLAALLNKKETYIALKIAAESRDIESPRGGLPDQVNDHLLIEKKQNWEKAVVTANEAQLAMDTIVHTGISDDVYQYVMERRTLEEAMDTAMQNIVSLSLIRATNCEVYAKHAGYITDVNIQRGQECSGNEVAVRMSGTDSGIVVRADLLDCGRSVEIGANTTLTGYLGHRVYSYITDKGYDLLGSPYADISIQAADISLLGPVSKLMSEGITVSINYESTEEAILLPVSAVRGSGSSQYVYEVCESENALGQTILLVDQVRVTVIDESSEYIAIADDLSGYGIAYMEDRTITAGTEVMVYE